MRKLKCLDFYGLPLKKGDKLIPLTEEALVMYNSKQSKDWGTIYLNEIINWGGESLINTSYFQDENNKTSENSGIFMLNCEPNLFTTDKHFKTEDPKHKYVVSAGRRINSDNLIDTGYRDSLDNIIYDTSFLTNKTKTIDDYETYYVKKINNIYKLVSFKKPKKVLSMDVCYDFNVVETLDVKVKKNKIKALVSYVARVSYILKNLVIDFLIFFFSSISNKIKGLRYITTNTKTRNYKMNVNITWIILKAYTKQGFYSDTFEISLPDEKISFKGQNIQFQNYWKNLCERILNANGFIINDKFSDSCNTKYYCEKIDQKGINSLPF